MLPLEEAVYGIKCLGVKIALPTLVANLCLNVLDQIQSATEPVLFTDLLWGGFPSILPLRMVFSTSERSS